MSITKQCLDHIGFHSILFFFYIKVNWGPLTVWLLICSAEEKLYKFITLGWVNDSNNNNNPHKLLYSDRRDTFLVSLAKAISETA